MLREKEMPYIGHLLTAEGVKPDPERIAAITKMEKPTFVLFESPIPRIFLVC
jgi:hypothetical protein